MFQWKSAYFAMSLLLTTCCAASLKGIDSIIKIPDECKGQNLCAIKPEGYHQLEANIENWLPKYLVQDSINVPKINLQSRVGEVEMHNHNCREEKASDLPYIYLYNDTNAETTSEILVQSSKFTQYIEAVKCRQLEEPLTADSNEQCFQHLGINTYNLKSSCETIWMLRPFFVFKEDRTGIIKKFLNVPVACSCVVSIL